jgi:hydroxymethylpyrimidine pyrophosphatase-like HAD family hydrolase
MVDLNALSIPELLRFAFYSNLAQRKVGLPPQHPIKNHTRPPTSDFPTSLHDTNSSINKLLEQIDLNSGKKYLLAFDIDGTLMDAFPNEMMFDIWRNGKSPDAAIQTLTKINNLKHPKIRSVCLTARCNDDFRLIPAFDDMPVYGNFGYLRTHNIRSAKDFHHDRMELLPELLDNYFNHRSFILALSRFGIQQNTDIVYDPNSFYLKLRDHNIDDKDKIKKVALAILNYSGRNWDSIESPDGTLIIFNNLEKPFDKAKGINHLIERESVNKDTTLVIFGDSGTDLAAMQEAKRVLGKDRVINVAVGAKLAKEEVVDTVFRDFIDTKRFIGRLNQKIQSKA